MKKSTFFYLCFLSVVLLSCKDDDPTVSPETDITIEIYAWYDTETSSRLLPDIDSRAFLYYNIDAETIRHSIMNNNGVLSARNKVFFKDAQR